MRRIAILCLAIVLNGLLVVSTLGSAASAGPAAESSVSAALSSAVAPASTVPFFPNIRVTDGSSGFTDQVEPTMVVNQSGTIYVGWKETNGAEAAGLRVGASHSTDRGETFAANILMNQSHPNQGCHNSDPWMALGPDDRVQYAYLEYDCSPTGLNVANTTNGQDWSNVHFMQGGGGLTDKESIVVDPLGRIYAAWDEGNELMVSWSDNGGDTWAPFKFPDDFPGGVLGAIIQVSPSGDLVYLTWWDFGSDDILFDWSGDRGLTWHTDVRVNSQGGSAQGGGWELPMPAMNVDPATGAIYNIWTDSRSGGMDIMASRSTNGGLTWGTNVRVNDVTTGTQRMPDIAIDGAGRVHAAWIDDRTGNHNIFYSNSTDGGQTWAPNVRVSTEETSSSLVRPGDYFAIEAAPNGDVYVVWTDGRGTDYEIYFARSPGFPAATLTLSTNPSGLRVSIDNVTMTSPAQKTVILGSTHTVGAPDPQYLGETVRYVWSSWSDGGARTHALVVNTDMSLVATFRKQVRATTAITPSGPSILVDNVSYAGPATFWWDQGTTHWLEATSPQVVAPDKRFVWVSWSDSGAQAHAVVANVPIDVAATFQQEHTLLVSTIPTGLTFTLDGSPATSPGTFWLALGSTHTIGVDTLQAGPTGVRYRFLDWSDGGAATHSISISGGVALTARFRAEYYLTVVSPVAGATGEGWYLAASTAYATVSTTSQDVAPGERLAFQGWAGDATGTAATSDGILMDGPKTAIAVYGTEYYLEVRSAYGATSGSGWYDAGSTANASVPGSSVSVGPGARRLFTGWSVDASGSNLTSDDIVMDAPKLAVANWKLQYALTIQTQYGVALTAGWYDAGATAVARLESGIVTISAGERALFLGWYGDASGTDPSGSTSITMNGAKVVLAVWQLEYELRIQTDYGTPVGAGWYASGSSAVAALNASTIPLGPASRVAFLSWSGDATGTSADFSDAIVMDGPKLAIATWKFQYRLTIQSAYGVARNAGWYDEGSTATARVDSGTVSLGTGTRAVFTGWSGDATGTGLTSNGIVMDRARTALASWQKEYLVTIVSDIAIEGGGWYAESASVTLTAPAQGSRGGQTYDFAGWSGDVSSSNPTVTFTVNAPTTARAAWTSASLLGSSTVAVVSLIALVVAAALVAFFLLWRRRRKKE